MSSVLDDPPVDHVVTDPTPASPTVIAPWAGALPRAPRPEGPPRPRHARRRAIRIALAVALTIGGWMTFDSVLAPLVHEQRQHHLAANYETPKPTIGVGDPLLVLQVESLGINEVVVEGVSVDRLRGGPAHWRGSALPGDAGVMVILGHRSGYGAPFADISTMKNGDSIVAQARNGGPIVRYVVDRVEVDASLADLKLDKTDVVSYMLLATSDGWLGDSFTVVVARALPVTDAEPVLPDLADVPRPAPFGLEALLAGGSLAAALLASQWLRGRASVLARVAVVAPPAVYGGIRLLIALDTVFALTR